MTWLTFLLTNWKSISATLVIVLLVAFSYHAGEQVEAAKWEKAKLAEIAAAQKQRDKDAKTNHDREVANEKQRQADQATTRQLQQEWEATDEDATSICHFSAERLRILNAALSGRPTASQPNR